MCRVEREKTEAMRHTLEEATAILEQLPIGYQQQQQQQQPPSPAPVQSPVQPHQQQQVPVRNDLYVRTVSRSDSPIGERSSTLSSICRLSLGDASSLLSSV
jgi:hypothetical protein